jgi:hypothetical protein
LFQSGSRVRIARLQALDLYGFAPSVSVLGHHALEACGKSFPFSELFVNRFDETLMTGHTAQR